jgi:uncharacterized SAM-dependent methyltransferase
MTIQRQLDPVATELRDALTRLPRTLPPRWLYDDRGSELFSQITGVPEYYQTETERQILADHSAAIAEITEAATVIELGSGTSDKTRTLLDSFVAHGLIERFVPLDVSEATLLAAAEMLREQHPEIDVDRSSATSPATSTGSRRSRHPGTGSSCSSAARSATSTSRSVEHSSGRSPTSSPQVTG